MSANEIESLRAQITALKRILVPFALYVEFRDNAMSNQLDPDSQIVLNFNDVAITTGDFRAALEALTVYPLMTINID